MISTTMFEFSPAHDSPVSLHPFFAVELPLPPGVNHSYQIVHIETKSKAFNRLADTPAAKRFKRDAAIMLTQASIYNLLIIDAVRTAAKTKHESPILSMTIRFYFPSPLKRDIDGGEKAVIDSVFAYLGIDDNLIFDKHTTKHKDVEHPRVEVELRCLLHHPE